MMEKTMTSPSHLLCSFFAVAILLTINTEAYFLSTRQNRQTTTAQGGWARVRHTTTPTAAATTTTTTSTLYMAEQEEDTVVDETAAAEETDDVKEEADEEQVAASAEEEDKKDEEPPQEDPEIVALKKEIADLEKKVKEKRRVAMDMGDRADDFTKAGYQRKVAEMENMRRARSMLNSSNKFSATAGVLAEFLPILDQLQDSRNKYKDEEFGKQYNALAGAFSAAFTNMGASEYTAKIGEKVDNSRVAVIDTEHSTELAANTVLRPVRVGLELQGNVIRMAECVASLGPEMKQDEELAPDAPKEDAAAAAEDEEEAQDKEE